MTESRRRVLTTAYTKLHLDISEILYYEDPEGMGVTTASPKDEYSGEAETLIRYLREHHDANKAGAAVRKMYPDATQSLVDRVQTAWADFLDKVQR